MHGNGRKDSEKTIHWLMTQGPRCASPAELLDGYCHHLRDAGVPVDRSTLGAPLLHPIAQSAYVFWDIDKGATLRWFRWTPDALETMHASPIHPIYSSGTASSIRLDRPEERARYPIGEDLWQEGYRQYEALPLLFSDDTFKALTFATKSASGFDSADMAAIKATMPALALVFEGFLTRNAARTLMETYVGKRAGLRVLDGEIARGDGTRIDAVICFSDLRNFTTLARSRDETALLNLLNDYFGRLTDAVEENEGEVLKFIGDAMLAVFPHENDLSNAVIRAEAAATKVLQADSAPKDYQFGLGLHPGSVFYGNIGGGTRLDFTVIGGAVNIASRIESLCSELGQPLLVSGDIVAHSGKDWTSVGTRQLKGVEQPMEIFAPGTL